MPNRRRRVVRVRRRRSGIQQLVFSAFAGLASSTHPTAQLVAGDEVLHRDYKPLFVVVQMTGTVGMAVSFTICGHDGDAVRAFGPYIVAQSVQTKTFRWPGSTDWFPAGKHTLVKGQILPCAGACPANGSAFIRFRATVQISDYNEGLTSISRCLTFEPPEEEGYVTAIE